MDSLNTDCLLEIIKLLSIKDQISLSQVSDSLQSAVLNFWRIKYKHLNINFLMVPLSPTDFEILAEKIQHFAQTLEMRFLNKQMYNVMMKFVFEHVTDFRFMISKPYFLEDRDLKDIRKALPNLRAFSPHGNFTGLYIDEWPLLKDLNLSFCWKLTTEPVETILSRLQLEKLTLNIFPSKRLEQMNLVEAQVQNLKYLEVNSDEFQYFLCKPLTALKELIITSCCSPNELFEMILMNWQAKDIRLMEAVNMKNILTSCVQMNFNIEKLTIVNDRVELPASIIPSLSLLTDMRKLRFVTCYVESMIFLNLLKNCNQLDEISFEYCQFDVAHIHVKVAEIFANRETKLKLNMLENRQVDNSPRPNWLREMEDPMFVSLNLIGNYASNMLELTHDQGEALRYEYFYIAFR